MPRLDHVEMSYYWMLASEACLEGHLSAGATGMYPSGGCRQPSLAISQADVGALAPLAARQLFQHGAPPDGSIQLFRSSGGGVSRVKRTPCRFADSPAYQSDRVGYSDSYCSYDVVDVSEFHHQLIRYGQAFVAASNHINGIKTFWSQVTRHLRRYDGIQRRISGCSSRNASPGRLSLFPCGRCDGVQSAFDHQDARRSRHPRDDRRSSPLPLERVH